MSISKKHVEKLGIDVSMLGFGCMRYPTKDGKIDRETAVKMLDAAYQAGVNYFDTAYPYHAGESEPFTGEALSKYPRDSYFLATKLPVWEVKTLDDAKRLFELQRSRIDGGYIDFYLLHAMNKERFYAMRDLGVIEYLASMKEEGKIKNFGFSFHDSYEVFEEMLSYRDWDFCQIQFNYMDTEADPGMQGYELAAAKNVPLVIMEPVKGGLLASLPEDVAKGFKAARPEASIASWALRFVASLPNVKVVLSGMSTEEQVRDNLATFDGFEPLSTEEEKLVEDTAAALKARVKNGCTGCNYCMPCPAGVNIPGNFRVWNRYGIYGNEGDAKWALGQMKAEEMASCCIKCGKCESVCPQKLSIRENLEQVAADFAGLL